MASSLDCPGTFTRTVKDAATLYEVMNGEDRQENTTYAGHDTIDSKIWQQTSLQGKKIGIPKEYFEEGLDAGVRETINQAIQTLKDL